MKNDKNIRRGIPAAVRAQLWVAAGGRCEFNCCNHPLDKHVITQAKLFVGEHAHIIGDSAQGPRGDAALSKKLEHDVSNLMLLCRTCHKAIDQHVDDYSVETLQEMKRRHESHIQSLYDLDGTKTSIPVILRHSIKRGHVPTFTVPDTQMAVLKNSKYCQRPSDKVITLEFGNSRSREHDQAYWVETVKQLKDDFQEQWKAIDKLSKVQHISVFAFAPMPLNIQLGVYLGNKGEVSTYQWSRSTESWLYEKERQYEQQSIYFDDVPESNGKELSVAISLSAEVDVAAVRNAVENSYLVNFRVLNPKPNLVESVDDIRHFRTEITNFLAQVRNRGYKKIHIFPAMPLSLAVELGRQILPKADPSIDIWDFQDSKDFIQTITLDYVV
mgnify:CR=1 FL=1